MCEVNEKKKKKEKKKLVEEEEKYLMMKKKIKTHRINNGQVNWLRLCRRDTHFKLNRYDSLNNIFNK